MSKKTKYENVSAGLDEALVQIEASARQTMPFSPKTAPGQLLAYRNEMLAYEERIAFLEKKIKDLESTSISVASISPNPWQPRRTFDEDELRKLAESISEVGLIQPIIVRRSNDVGTPDTYQIVAGERRWRAYQILGLEQIKAIVVEVSNDEMAMLALTENYSRENLTAYEVARAIREIEKNFSSKKSLAAALGINRTDLYKFLSFFQLPDFVIEDLEALPHLLGRDAAEDVASVLRRHGQPAVAALAQLWPKLRAGKIEQGALAKLIESSLRNQPLSVPTHHRSIKKLFLGTEFAGSITRDASKFKIEIKASIITPHEEEKITAFVESLLAERSGKDAEHASLENPS